MDFAVREDRILSVHELVEENTKRISIVIDAVARWILFEVCVIEIRNICSV